jgi:hypothetical protein
VVRVGGGVAGRLLRYLQVAVEVLELPNSCVEHPHRGYCKFTMIYVHFYFILSLSLV